MTTFMDLILFASDVLRNEVAPRLDLPTAIALSWTTSDFNKLLSPMFIREMRNIRIKKIDIRENVCIFFEEIVHGGHWGLFRFFLPFAAESLRTLRSHSYLQ